MSFERVVGGRRRRVVVVGGGLGGLTTALALRQRGIEVTVLEQAAQFGEVGAGIQTAPNASRILMELGLRRELEAIHTEPLDQVRRRWADGSIVGQTSLGEHCKRTYNAPYWHYHRADLHRVLLDACDAADVPGPKVELITSARVDTVDQDTDHAAVTTSDGRIFEGDAVIGADGIRSVVRDRLGFADTLEFSGEMAFRALIPGDLIRQDPATRWLFDRFQSTIWYGPDRHLVHYLIRGGDLLNVVAIVPCTEDMGTWSRSATAEEMIAEFHAWDDRALSILSKAKDDVSAWALYHRRPDPVWVDGRVALLGDACHAMLPYQAQGGSQAMEDAAVLAEELARVPSAGVPEALTRYASRRSTRAGIIQQASFQNMSLYHLPDGPEQRERDRMLSNFTGESDVSYDWLWRGTPLDTADTENFGYQFSR